MSGPTLRYYVEDVVIPASGITPSLGLPGKMLFILEAPTVFQMAIDGQTFQRAEKGLKLNVPEGFGNIQFKNTTAVDITVRLAITDGTIDLNKQILEGTILTKSGNIINNFAQSINNVAGGAQIVAANANRNCIVIKNTHATNSIFLGKDTTITAANGFPLLPGETISIDSSAAVWGLGSAGVATTIRCIESLSQ